MPRLATLAILAVPALALSACGDDVLNGKDLEKQLADQLAPQGGAKPADIAIACPPDQKVEKGRTFTCELTAPDGTKAPVRVTLTNDSGGYKAVVLPPQ
jgi:hypothetical protein